MSWNRPTPSRAAPFAVTSEKKKKLRLWFTVRKRDGCVFSCSRRQVSFRFQFLKKGSHDLPLCPTLCRQLLKCIYVISSSVCKFILWGMCWGRSDKENKYKRLNIKGFNCGIDIKLENMEKGSEFYTVLSSLHALAFLNLYKSI